MHLFLNTSYILLALSIKTFQGHGNLWQTFWKFSDSIFLWQQSCGTYRRALLRSQEYTDNICFATLSIENFKAWITFITKSVYFLSTIICFIYLLIMHCAFKALQLKTSFTQVSMAKENWKQNAQKMFLFFSSFAAFPTKQNLCYCKN